MKNYLIYSFSILTILFSSSCSEPKAQNAKTELSAEEFSSRIKELPSVPIIDVRTPGEFSKGHLQNAKNIDWNGNSFEDGIAKLDKSKPVFVYCASGRRSSDAADHMRDKGFKEVYELEGGIMKWRSAGLPETTDNSIASEGMSRQQFDELLNNDKLVLVDFYAEWCPPCKKMKPYLDEISNDMADKVIVIRIDADDNRELCKELKIEGLPVLQLYKNKTLIWNNEGFIDKETVVKQIK